MKKRKKTFILITLILLAVAVLAVCFMNSRFVKILQLQWDVDNRYYASGFDDNFDSFNKLASYIIDNSELLDEDGTLVMGYDSQGVPSLTSLENGNGIERKDLSKELRDAIDEIMSSFAEDSVQPSFIQSDGKSRVAFVVIDQEYAIVYTKDNKKPTYVYSEANEKGHKYRIKKLCDNWYTIADKELGI